MKSKIENSGVISYADIARRRAAREQSDVSSGNPTSEPPKFVGILFFDEADALYDEPVGTEGEKFSSGSVNGS